MSETVLFDTHKIVKRFIESGFTEKQAEIIIEEQKSIIENNLANKQDIAETHLKIEIFRQETNKEITLIKKDIELIKKDVELIKKDIASFKQETNIQIAEIKREIASFKQETNVQIAEIKKDMEVIKKEIDLTGKKIMNKMYISIFACLGFFTTIMTVIMTIIIKSLLIS